MKKPAARPFETCRKNTLSATRICRLQNKDGRRNEVEFVSNLYDEDGHEVIQCNIRDITRRKRAEEALRQAEAILVNHAAEMERLVDERTAELQETIGELESFSYSVSH